MNALTVVVPVKNRAGRVQQTLHSLGVQDAPVDYVLVDNASTDNTRSVLEDWALEMNKKNFGGNVQVLDCHRPGAAAARNEGLARVTTPFVLFFDSDDVMRPGHLQRVLDYLERNPETDILGFKFLLHQAGGRTKEKHFPRHDRHFSTVFHGGGATLLWSARTGLVRRAGAWDESVSLWDDAELVLRLLNTADNLKYGYLSDISADIYETEDSLTLGSVRPMLERIETPLHKFARNLPVDKRVWVEYVRMIYAGHTRRQGDEARASSACREVLRRNRSRRHRFLLKFAYLYTSWGMRGAARLLRHFI